MKRLFVVLFAAVLVPVASRGQVEVLVRVQNARVLRSEPIFATLGVVNNTGEVLAFTGPRPNATLRFDVEQSPGALVPETGEALLDQPTVVEPGRKLTRKINLLSKYGIRVTGPYTITARVEWGDKVFISPKVFLDVVPGLEIRRLGIGVPGGGGTTRLFSLRTLSRDRGERIFLRVDDEATGRCLGVSDLGGVIRFEEPVLQADEAGDVHVIHQCGPDRFAHNVFDADGRLTAETRYSSSISGATEGGASAAEAPAEATSGPVGHSMIPPPDAFIVEPVPAE